jgi:hypothetical protein
MDGIRFIGNSLCLMWRLLAVTVVMNLRLALFPDDWDEISPF